MKIFGFDIGIASIGWAFIEDEKIKDCGVRIFSAAEEAKTGASLALPRREARSARRRLARRKGRLDSLKYLIAKEFKLNVEDYFSLDGVLPRAYISSKNSPLESPYYLRYKALRVKLSKEDLARVILHIAKHRGYGNKNAKDSDKEKGEVLKALEENQESIKEFKSAGEFLYVKYCDNKRDTNKERLFKDLNAEKKMQIRIRNSNESYEHCIAQGLFKDELELIFQKQRDFGFDLSEKFTQEILQIAFHQRPLKDFSHKVGNCIFIENEKRVAKDSPSAIEFVALTRIINTLQNLQNQSGLVFEDGSLEKILKVVLEKGNITYAKLREILSLDERIFFRDSKLDYTKDLKEAEKTKFIEFKNLVAFKKALGENYSLLSRESLDSIATDITLTKDTQKLQKKLYAYKLSNEVIEKLCELNFAKHINLSFKALEKILPFMRKGLRYDEAVDKAGLKEIKKIQEKCDFLPPLCDSAYKDDLTNPVVNRAISEYRKILNALLEKYGKVHKIHIELTREVGKNSTTRKAYEKEQRENLAKKQEAKRFCEQIGLKTTERNIFKARLFIEQGEFCAYSGEKITINDLKDEKKVEVDHIYPYSRSFDDSYMNKVLALIKNNQNKRNKTPFEAFGDSIRWDKIQNLAKRLPKKKAFKILNKNFKERDGFKSRNLNDTSYIATLISNYTRDYLKFLPLDEKDEGLSDKERGGRKRVQATSGMLTSMLRHTWGFGDKDRNNHLHHAIDAIIVAFSTDKVVNAFSKFKSKQEQFSAKYYAKLINESDLKENIKTQKKLCLPSENFRDEVINKVENIFVSKPVRRKATGALHKETFNKEESYYGSYGGKEGVEKAIAFGKIRRIGTKIVENGEMIRVDIFKDKKNRFYAVPIYTMDIALGILPNKAIAIGKKDKIIKDWIEMDENYTFCFSLFKDDLIYIQKKDMEKPELCYYKSLHSGVASICVEKHNNKIESLSKNEKKLYTKAIAGEVEAHIGIKTLKIFEKWQVNCLGEIKKLDFYPREMFKKKDKDV